MAWPQRWHGPPGGGSTCGTWDGRCGCGGAGDGRCGCGTRPGDSRLPRPESKQAIIDTGYTTGQTLGASLVAQVMLEAGQAGWKPDPAILAQLPISEFKSPQDTFINYWLGQAMSRAMQRWRHLDFINQDQATNVIGSYWSKLTPEQQALYGLATLNQAKQQYPEAIQVWDGRPPVAPWRWPDGRSPRSRQAQPGDGHIPGRRCPDGSTVLIYESCEDHGGDGRSRAGCGTWDGRLPETETKNIADLAHQVMERAAATGYAPDPAKLAEFRVGLVDNPEQLFKQYWSRQISWEAIKHYGIAAATDIEQAVDQEVNKRWDMLSPAQRRAYTVGALVRAQQAGEQRPSVMGTWDGRFPAAEAKLGAGSQCLSLASVARLGVASAGEPVPQAGVYPSTAGEITVITPEGYFWLGELGLFGLNWDEPTIKMHPRGTHSVLVQVPETVLAQELAIPSKRESSDAHGIVTSYVNNEVKAGKATPLTLAGALGWLRDNAAWVAFKPQRRASYGRPAGPPAAPGSTQWDQEAQQERRQSWWWGEGLASTGRSPRASPVGPASQAAGVPLAPLVLGPPSMPSSYASAVTAGSPGRTMALPPTIARGSPPTLALSGMETGSPFGSLG